MPDPLAEQLAVVIPTRGRDERLAETLGALDRQTVSGFEVVVVVDGDDQPVPALDPSTRVVVQTQSGPGAARNRGARSTDRPLVLFLGDDMVPTARLVEHHLRRHQAEPADEVAVLGHVDWHPAVARDRVARWMDWSATQFDYASLAASGADEAGFARFYSCNVSLKRRFFLDAGGFDPAFAFYYEDLDAGYRLGQAGMRLRYEPAAVAWHHHRYDRAGLERRFRGIAVGERLMARRHAWFTPFFRDRVLAARSEPAPSPLWPVLVERVPAAFPRLRARARHRANTWYHQHLAGPFLGAWEGERGREELEAYLGDAYDHARLVHHVAGVEAEERAAPDERTFYRTSEAYLYDLTVFAMSGTKEPYLDAVRAAVPAGGRILDYGCGIGSDGLRLLEEGYRVEFADFDNPSTRFLRWRLEQRGLDAPVHDIERAVPGGFDLVCCFDVVEHVDDPQALLALLESKAALVAVNLLEPAEGDTHVHRPLDVGALLARAGRRGLRSYAKHHGRSHLVVYVSGRPARANALRAWALRAGDVARRRLEARALPG